MGRYTGKTCRLICMLSMTFSFFLVEIVVGYLTNSMALVADSFHMLSDVVSLVVGLGAVRISRVKTSKNTFGWARAEVLGALVNAVFLAALCFSILVESIQRLIEIEEITDPVLILVVGGAGLLINLVGLFLFHGHGHGHSHGGGGHGHSHGGHAEDSHDEEEDLMVTVKDGSSTLANGDVDSKDGKKTKEIASSSQLNMRGVFLHVLGDALGSVVVMISATIIWQAKGDWKYYVDPAMSIGMVIIIMSTTYPLLKESGLILLQTVPPHLKMDALKKKLIEQVEGVLAVHEFHIWQLAGNRIIASAHIKVRNLADYMLIAEKIKEFFHNEGIHSTTIQPEFVEPYDEMFLNANLSQSDACFLACAPEKNCVTKTCCGKPGVENKEGIRQRNGSGGGIENEVIHDPVIVSVVRSNGQSVRLSDVRLADAPIQEEVPGSDSHCSIVSVESSL
ncbi:proton-coupled zinc antiporter SLC30A1-like [Branchiostoma lanceolatum]|uniref:SLC30A1 protein n=1 Tax=Branchiostoma lanceolatum TaxID=7740 RepID=A0A8J9ZMJ2_BRALA|nr:SLC30A1 [Branchiostoma lanceolatum]